MLLEKFLMALTVLQIVFSKVNLSNIFVVLKRAEIMFSIYSISACTAVSAAGQSTAASEGGVTMVGVGAEGVPDRSLGTPPCGGSPAPTVTTISSSTFLRTLSPDVPTARKSHPLGEISSKL